LNQAGIHAFTCAPWDGAHPYRSFIRSYRAVRQILKGNSIEIVHSHSLFGDIAALLLNFQGKAPIIIRTLHNELRTEWSRRPLRRLFLTNLLYPLVFDLEIGVSQFITQNLNRRWLARKLKRQAITIHNAIDINRFKKGSHDLNTLRLEFNIPEDAYLIGSVGRLTKQKGYDLLIEAAAIAINKFPALYFIIIGDGEEASLLRNRAEELEISHRIVFTGSRSDVDTLLTAMDLFVCSSRWEGLSTVLMEAMAVGIPILATDLPGNRELLQPGVSGWFVPVENSSELADGIINAVQNPDQSKEFAKIAKIKVDSFGMEEIARLHTRLYKLIRANKDRNNWINHQYADEEITRQIGSS
jgi:glycosyltransferase involved in cell wall biosynthesis